MLRIPMWIWVGRLTLLGLLAGTFWAEDAFVNSERGMRSALDACGVSSLLAAVDSGKSKCVTGHLHTMRMMIFGAGVALSLILSYLVFRTASRQGRDADSDLEEN